MKRRGLYMYTHKIPLVLEPKMEIEETAESSSDESLDIKSDKFDPFKALYSKKLRLPVSNARVYDNVSKYETTLVRDSSSSEKPGKVSLKENTERSERPRRRFLPHQEPVASGSGGFTSKKYIRDESREKNVLTRMKGTLGPLEMLLQCMEHRTRVKVYTRGARSIRGYVLAYVAAFDKHWNLALEDCLEVWTRKVKRKAPALGVPDVQEINRKIIVKKSEDGKIETVERHVPQMMVRGEQIAIIVKID